ncbi:RDD family protein [Streptomyces spiramenti]|uniref:RDD family protein n=1 Tax=Streptomyces spiramenti TaxID=2720606 RepID=A0ABX1AMJ5_9ACTN|nr:RDD family protein [Streptomyces spiramenti]NJP68332.1 RDD family protein [Streptomyces spiramenti]
MSYPPQPGNEQNPYGQGQNPYGQQGQPGHPQQGQPGGYPGYPQQGQPGGYPGYPQQGGHHGGVVPNAYAGWGSRVVAYILDYIVFYTVPAILMVAGTPTVVGESPGGLYYFGVLLSIAAMILWGYLTGTTGQTPGKKAVSIEVLKESTGKPVGAGIGIARTLLHIVNALPCFLGFLWPLWDAKKQTFADKIVGTVVVRKI